MKFVKYKKGILEAYEQDFSKHAPNVIVPKIRMLWNQHTFSACERKQKIYLWSYREGARAKEYEEALMWLCDCGLVHKISRVNTGRHPFESLRRLKGLQAVRR